jgi:hypothetical protein
MLDRMSDEEYQAFIASPKAKAHNEARASDRGADRQPSEPSIRMLEDTVRQLRTARSRDEADRIISTLRGSTTRDDLLRLAKYLSVHVTKQDTRESIEHKLIEVSVGARLRSEAIKQTVLK